MALPCRRAQLPARWSPEVTYPVPQLPPANDVTYRVMAPRAALLLLAAAAALALVCGASADDVAKSPGDGAAADAAAGGAGAAVKTYEYFVIPSQCVSRFLDNKDFFDATCNKLVRWRCAAAAHSPPRGWCLLPCCVAEAVTRGRTAIAVGIAKHDRTT